MPWGTSSWHVPLFSPSPFKPCSQPGVPLGMKKVTYTEHHLAKQVYLTLAHSVHTASLSDRNCHRWWRPEAQTEGRAFPRLTWQVHSRACIPTVGLLYNLHAFHWKMGLMLDTATGLLCGVGEITLADMPAQCLVQHKGSMRATSPSPSLPSPMLHPREIHDLSLLE